MCFFKVKLCFAHISGMVGPIGMKKHQLGTGYNM